MLRTSTVCPALAFTTPAATTMGRARALGSAVAPALLAILLLPSVACHQVTATKPPRALSIAVDHAHRLGSATVLANYLQAQGMVRDGADSFETAAWRDLAPGVGLGTESMPIINDEWYAGEGGIQVFRSKTKDDEAWWGPYGPAKDLRFSVEEFERHRSSILQRLGIPADRLAYGIFVMPKTLSSAPDSPKWHAMAPNDSTEWSALMVAIATYLRSIGLDQPHLMFFGEPENGYFGKGHDTAALPEVAREYAEHYCLTHEAIRSVLPGAQIAGAGHATFNEELTQVLQDNPNQWGLESTLRELAAIDPDFIPHKLTALGVQGYLFETGVYGHTDFRPAMEHVRALLKQYSSGVNRHIPIHVLGWNGTWTVDIAEIPMDERPAYFQKRLDQEAAFMAASAIDFLNPGGERGYDFGYYYTWNLDGTCQMIASIVSTVHPEDPDWDATTPGCHTPASEVACVRAPYRAMAMLDEGYRLEHPITAWLSDLARRGA
ncbi:MAG: hypothetical protein HYV63_08505 [Candidatus Schekmanbacteria bacterium]|nr:hypothetical protein [Candidatus Schekmanbacteria bacterium]